MDVDLDVIFEGGIGGERRIDIYVQAEDDVGRGGVVKGSRKEGDVRAGGVVEGGGRCAATKFLGGVRGGIARAASMMGHALSLFGVSRDHLL